MDWIAFIGFFAACCAAAASGALFPPGDWYDELARPSWTPPNWLFPVAWTTIYILISVAGARIAALPNAGVVLSFWAAQIVINAIWSPVYFGLRRMKASLIIIGALWIAVAATMAAFWSYDPVAGALFAPYLLWVTIAGALNYQFLRLNPSYAT